MHLAAADWCVAWVEHITAMTTLPSHEIARHADIEMRNRAGRVFAASIPDGGGASTAGDDREIRSRGELKPKWSEDYVGYYANGARCHRYRAKRAASLRACPLRRGRGAFELESP